MVNSSLNGAVLRADARLHRGIDAMLKRGPTSQRGLSYDKGSIGCFGGLGFSSLVFIARAGLSSC